MVISPSVCKSGRKGTEVDPAPDLRWAEVRIDDSEDDTQRFTRGTRFASSIEWTCGNEDSARIMTVCLVGKAQASRQIPGTGLFG
jgi:hypothetical protein